MNYTPMFEIDNEREFVIEESKRLMSKYKGVRVVPAFYKIENDRIYLLKE